MLLRNKGKREDGKIAAAERILEKWLPADLVAQKRKVAIGFMLELETSLRAKDHGISLQFEKQRIGKVNLLLAVKDKELRNFNPFAGKEVLGILRRRLNDLVTEDVLGDDWRRGKKEVPDPDLEVFPFRESPHGRVSFLEAKLDVAKLLNRTHLSNRESQVITLLKLGMTEADIARELGKSPSTIRVLYHRALKKIKKPKSL